MHLKQSIAILKLILNLIGSQWRRINDDVTCSCLGNERLSPHLPAQKSVYFPRRGILFKQTFRHLEFYQSQKKILWFFLLWQVFRTWSTKSDLQRKYSPLEENIFINLLPLSVTIISPLSYIDKPSIFTKLTKKLTISIKDLNPVVFAVCHYNTRNTYLAITLANVGFLVAPLKLSPVGCRAGLGTGWVTHREYRREGPCFVLSFLLLLFCVLYGVILKVYWRAYLALFRPSGCKKKYKHASTIRGKNYCTLGRSTELKL